MHDVIVLSTTNLTPGQLQRISGVSPRVRLEQVICKRASQVSALLKGVEVLLTEHGGFQLDRADRLRWVQMRSAGIDDSLEKPVMSASGIAITTASGIHATPIAEFVLGLLVALVRKLPKASNLQRERRWPADRWRAFLGRELRGRTIGILGYGSIGREVGRIAHCLGMEVLALTYSGAGQRKDRGYRIEGTGDSSGCIPQAWYGPSELHEFLGESDIVLIAVPLTSDTRGLIGEDCLRAMRKDAFLVNIARGEIIQEDALIRALREGWIAGAALDVFAKEPLPSDHPFYGLDNVMITPHMAGMTDEHDERLATLFAENLKRYLAGDPLLNLVDRQKEY